MRVVASVQPGRFVLLFAAVMLMFLAAAFLSMVAPGRVLAPLLMACVLVGALWLIITRPFWRSAPVVIEDVTTLIASCSDPSPERD